MEPDRMLGTSQYGEDLIISKLIKNTDPKVCCEIGANDGVNLSNTAFLWRNGWAGTLIEINRDHWEKLAENTIGYKTQVLIAKATPENINELVPDNCSVLSIDVDGDDYWLWSMLEARPAIVIIEFNPTIPYWLDVRSAYGENYGCSVGALMKLGESKGYFLADATQCNLIFTIRKRQRTRKTLEELIGRDNLTYLTTDYLGHPRPIGPMPFGYVDSSR